MSPINHPQGRKRLIKHALRGEERLMGTFTAHVDVQYISTYISINLGPSFYRSLFTWTGVDLFWRTSARNGVYMGSHNRTVSFSVQLFPWDCSRKICLKLEVHLSMQNNYQYGSFLRILHFVPPKQEYLVVSLVLGEFLLSTDSQKREKGHTTLNM